MKYLYLAILAPAFVAISWVTLNGTDNAGIASEFLPAHHDINETGDVTETLSLLVPRKPIPRIPLKDLFVDPASRKVEEERIVLKEVQHSPQVEAEKSSKITTTPRLVGILIRSTEAKAFFVDNDKAYSLKKGDKLSGRYRITAISSDRVNITEISTGLSRTIYAKDE